MYIPHDWLAAPFTADMAKLRRQENEARAARGYAAWRWMWKALTRPLSAVLARQQVARRRRQNLLTLEALDEATLRDIGLTPGELRAAAAISARFAGRSGLTVAETRRLLSAEETAQRAMRVRAEAAARPPRVVRATETAAPAPAVSRPVLPRMLRVVPTPAATAECCG